ncbi:MAG: Gfo/Idh/MocA family oxidoreductase [Chthoniobacterales bacterium]
MDGKYRTFGLIGGGWRAEFFLRIARDLPERFPLTGVVVRNATKREHLAAHWDVPVFATAEELLAATKPAFVITSVEWEANLPLLEFFADRDVPVLSETPIAPTLSDLLAAFALVQKGAKIQVAEQYLFRPQHAAGLRMVESGRLGNIHAATVSMAHGYHGISLLRRYLTVDMELPRISARKFISPLIAGPGREGPPRERILRDSQRVIAELDYGSKLGIYDFTDEQYFSWIQSPHLLVRGEQGEINQKSVRYLRDFQTPVHFEMQRRDKGHDGDLDGYSHHSIVGNGEVLYQNPFPGMRWSDEEIAVATSLSKMGDYVNGGASFYPVAQACQDRYLDILLREAAETGRTLEPQPQPWMSANPA